MHDLRAALLHLQFTMINMKNIYFLLIAAISFPVYAGDLWEINSTSAGPDGNPLAYTEKKCFPKDGMNPAQMLTDLGNCTFNQKSGDASALTFSMTCKMQGMPAEMESMKVNGDARLNGDKFNMRYTITMVGGKAAPGADFKMTGKAEARKVGQCDGP